MCFRRSLKIKSHSLRVLCKYLRVSNLLKYLCIVLFHGSRKLLVELYLIFLKCRLQDAAPEALITFIRHQCHLEEVLRPLAKASLDIILSLSLMASDNSQGKAAGKHLSEGGVINVVLNLFENDRLVIFINFLLLVLLV